MRLRRVLAVTGAAAAVAGAATPAFASSPSPWQPFREQPFTNPAGTVCPFAVHGDIVEDHELFRTVQTNPDGSPRTQEFVGPLVIKFTNLSTGASAVRNLTGTGFFTTEADGTITGNGRGHIAIGINPHTNPPSRAGEWVLTGKFDFVLGADGTRTFHVQGGNAENLCETLA